jgi:hypothetical protein
MKSPASARAKWFFRAFAESLSSLISQKRSRTIELIPISFSRKGIVFYFISGPFAGDAIKEKK